ncbi:MAG TPA: DUF998 domain-containing protein [Kribbella sp.]|nr:DUF998 domain-containing protein [Kribbella sp.]
MNQTTVTTRQTSALLAAGVAAGPVFILTAVAQILFRDGFDLSRHPLSLLSLGDLGWIQITNFVVSGLLVLAFAVGLRQVLHPGRAGTWGPILVCAFGVGLILGGAFLTDPSLGFPVGAPADLPETRSRHAIVHDLAPGLALDAIIVATIVVARRFARGRQWSWVAYCAATGTAVLVLSFWPSLDGISIRLALAVATAFAWVSALAVRLRADLA